VGERRTRKKGDDAREREDDGVSVRVGEATKRRQEEGKRFVRE
jgi:hypothetical protein